MKIEKYDLIVIGGGPAGTPTAIEYAMINPTKKVLLIDKKGELGGECLFDGCIPSKILEISANAFSSLNRFKLLGINLNTKKPKLIWEDIVKKKNEILTKRTNSAQKKLNLFKNIILKKGTASFVDKQTIKLILPNNKSELVSFEKAVIATGSRTFIPPLKGNGLDKLWTNKEFFDNMDLPEDIVIIGAGPIGLELAQILASLNVKVTIFEFADGILPMIEKRFSKRLLEKLKSNNNIDIHLSSSVNEINFKKNKFQIKYSQNEITKEITSSKVLVSTGRTPNLEDLNLKNANLKFDKKGIIVNDYLQTSNKNIYAGGDVILKGPQFAHTASYEAHIITQNLFFGRNKFKTNFDKNSWVLFSDPNIVSAGITEDEAKKRNIDIIVGYYDYSIDAKSQIENEADGFLKFVVNKKNLEIIGISIIAKDANTLAGEAALIITKNYTLKDLVDVIHPHPTLSESFGFLAKQMMGEIMIERMKNPLFKIGFFIKKWLP